MTTTTADRLVETLLEWGVDTIFGLPGDGINGIMEQMVMLGNPEYGCSLHPIDFAALARAFGATGLTCDDPARIGAVLEEALETQGPVVVEAVVDPNEPPLPPKITARQARRFTEALVRGQPDRMDIALTVLEDKVRELILTGRIDRVVACDRVPTDGPEGDEWVVGADPAPDRDPDRMAWARGALEDGALMVDANRPRVREHGPPGMDVAAGERAVDVVQIDATRCRGLTGGVPQPVEGRVR